MPWYSAVAERAALKPVYLTGDWNAVPQSKELESVRGFMKLLSAAKGRTYYGFEKHDPSSEFCIDYVAVDAASAAARSLRTRRRASPWRRDPPGVG